MENTNREKPANVNYIQASVEEPLRFQVKYDCIFCFEVIEHIDCTDVLIKNCYDNLKEGGLLFISCPNLASFYSRVELLFGFQPHLLEISNEYANYGTGIFGKVNNPADSVLHHIRGITYRAMRDMLKMNKLKIVKVMGNDASNWLKWFPKISSTIVFVCTR